MQLKYLHDQMLTDYQNFVDEVTSDASKNKKDFSDSIDIMEEKGIVPSRLLTSGIGLSGEIGEFNEIIKKTLFQGKEIDDHTKQHLKKELGDVMWYVAQGCIALDTSITEIININIEKLQDRYDGGSFDVTRSENRKEGVI